MNFRVKKRLFLILVFFSILLSIQGSNAITGICPSGCECYACQSGDYCQEWNGQSSCWVGRGDPRGVN